MTHCDHLICAQIILLIHGICAQMTVLIQQIRLRCMSCVVHMASILPHIQTRMIYKDSLLHASPSPCDRALYIGFDFVQNTLSSTEQMGVPSHCQFSISAGAFRALWPFCPKLISAVMVGHLLSYKGRDFSVHVSFAGSIASHCMLYLSCRSRPFPHTFTPW